MAKHKLSEAPADKDLEKEPEWIKKRAETAPESPLEKPSSLERGQTHRFEPIRNYGKADYKIPSIAGDGPVSVRGPDEREMSRGSDHMVATFNYRNKDKAMLARKSLLDGSFGIKAERVDGPKQDKLDDGTLYFAIGAIIALPEGKTPKEMEQYLRARKAAKVDGPVKLGAKTRYELTIQKRSGATETLLYKTKEEAITAKEEIEQSIKDNPVQGVSARRVGAGVSALRQRGITQGKYFSEKDVKKREHFQMMKDDPKSAKIKIADHLGLTLALDDAPGELGKMIAMEKDMLRRKHGAEKASQMISNAKDQLKDYIKSLEDVRLRGARNKEELDKLKPKFDGGFVGQTHTVKGSLQRYSHRYIDPKTGELKRGGGYKEGRSSYEFVWDGEEWLEPFEYQMKRRGSTVPTRKVDPKDPEVATVKPKPEYKGKKQGIIAPDDPRYEQHYIDVLTAVGRHYNKSPLTQGMAQAMLDVARVTRAKGSPTKKSLEHLSNAIERLKSEYETNGNNFSIEGKKNVETAIHAGYLVLSQSPPMADEFPDEEPVSTIPFHKQATAGGRLGISKPPSEPKSVYKGYKKAREPGRKYVAVAPGLPPKVLDKVPREYTKTSKEGWAELMHLLAGEDDTRFEKPIDSSAWRALKKKLGDKLSRHTAKEPQKEPAQAAQKATEPQAAAPAKEPAAKRDLPQDAPWRALAKAQKDLEDEEE